jgi:peptide/nickel transport system substrate-binding protein
MRKNLLFIVLLLLIVSSVALFAGGDKEASKSPEKIIRVADQVPGLITPGSWDGQTFSMNSSIYEYLIEIDAETGELTPLLATSWNSEDGKKWVFKLQQGVTFHDGSTFDSQDVKFSIERTQDPEIGHLKKQDFAIVSSIETPDPHTVVINLSESRPTFVYQLTDYNMAMLSSDYDYLGLGESKPMGTGPFKMVRLIPKESAELHKNAEYWNPELPKIDKLLIYFVSDIDSAISMLEADRVDVVPFANPIIKQRLDKIDGLSVITPYQEQRFVAMVESMKPFDDNRVRLALKYAMDPKVLARATQLSLGDGVSYNETPIMNMLAEYKELPMRERDIEKSKALLAEAGYPDGVTVELYYASDHPFSQDIAQTIKELAEPAGFDIELKGYTRDIYLSQYWLNVPFCITGWGGRIDPSMLLSLAYHSEGPWNESHINNPKVDRLIDLISAEVDDDTRRAYYHELQELFYEEGTVLNVQVPFMVAISDKVVNYRHPLTMIPQYKYVDIK